MRYQIRKCGWIAVITLALLILSVLAVSGETIHVSIGTGNNKNPGTAAEPMKNMDKAINKAQAGDTLLVAEGTYSGTFSIGYLEMDKPLELYGGYSTDFAERDVVAHPTLFQPDNKSGAKSRKALLKLSKEVDGTIIDGFIFDMGMRNSYSPDEGKTEGVETGMLLLPPQKKRGENATVTEQCISIASGNKGGAITIRNNVFLNGAKFAIQGGIPSGLITITNNVFVAHRMAAIEVWGTSAGKDKPSGSAEIAHNTILFTWSRLKDFLDMGYGVRIMTKMEYNIHHNIIGTSILTGVDHTRFNNDEWIQLDHNLFLLNKQGDMEFSPGGNTKLNLSVDEFGDLEFASVEGNTGEIPPGFPINQAYMEGFLSALYTEDADLDSESPANRMRGSLGLEKRGELTSEVTMYGNRYPCEDALKLFGAVAGVGAQTPQ